ncbi:membrane protein [Burkholderia pseudomallei]|nr:hypothetical protein [Burkholderia pseudomallei]CAJ2838119.1 membrane protein [Burkholderia pseudomallei]CAJ2839439.1 membrane protein [Burkholderia pseudomallei]CAJ2852209.1 membrane protein [Burkholderia pseudomallei]CAJ2944422.1 membrane protein [Burkholderia pseudomallei]CAJ2947739.1 membrane protein [Burkholderia pseudomallei]
MTRHSRHAAQREAQRMMKASRELNRSAILLALSVLADSGVEHYRGSFRNRAMLAPLAASALSLAAAAHGHADGAPRRHPARDAVHLGAAAAAVAGVGFHVYNVLKRPGHLSWHNLFYGAPLGAPVALLLSGLLGAAGERLRACPEQAPRLCGLPAGRALAALVAAGLAGTVGEVALLHFRGAFHHRAMVAPLVVPPVAALLVAHAALAPARPNRWFSRAWLKATAALGIAGVGFHVYGVARQMGGWRNWAQNLLAGPPLPAPPGFSALALAGLSAVSLAEREAGA